MSTIVIFSGGELVGSGVLQDLPAPHLSIAADGGYLIASAIDYPVDVLVGDLDSIDQSEISSSVLIERHSPDKDQTDLDLALELAIRDDPERIIIVGGAGGRHDHEIAIATLLASDRWRNVDEIDWISNRSRAHVVRGRRLIHVDVGLTVSLIPVGGGAFGVTTGGLKWNLDNEVLPAGSTRGVSNVTTAPVVDVRVGNGTLLLVLPADHP